MINVIEVIKIVDDRKSRSNFKKQPISCFEKAHHEKQKQLMKSSRYKVFQTPHATISKEKTRSVYQGKNTHYQIGH